MRILFEELSTPQRAGGIEAATHALDEHLGKIDVSVTRSSHRSMGDEPDLPDCVHVHGIWAPQLARRCLFWKSRGVPCVVSPHGMLEPWALNHKRWKKQIAWHGYQKRILNGCSLLHATSEREAASLRALKLKPPIAIIPWGIDCQQSDNSSSLQNSKSSIPKTENTALFVGRIYPVKGLPMLVEAWAKVRPAGWKMKIVGPDEAGHRAEIEALVGQAGLRGEFEFVGPLNGEDLQRAYEDADLFVLPSHTENFSMAVGEAMSHALPVITTHGAPWKLLADEQCGWWVPVSVCGIASALEDATQRRAEDLTAMGERGRRVVAARFAWDQITGQVVDCYQWVLGTVPKPSCVV